MGGHGGQMSNAGGWCCFLPVLGVEVHEVHGPLMALLAPLCCGCEWGCGGSGGWAAGGLQEGVLFPYCLLHDRFLAKGNTDGAAPPARICVAAVPPSCTHCWGQADGSPAEAVARLQLLACPIPNIPLPQRPQGFTLAFLQPDSSGVEDRGTLWLCHEAPCQPQL